MNETSYRLDTVTPQGLYIATVINHHYVDRHVQLILLKYFS